jgi:hypothetical protein
MSLFFSPLLLLWFALAPTWAAHATSYKIENQQFQRVTQITCPWLAK